MEAHFAKIPELTAQRPRAASVWDAIAAPTTSGDITMCSSSTSHGGFDDDEDTRVAVIERIVRRQSAAPGPNGLVSKAKSLRKPRPLKKGK
jgi:hypothetical protein